MRAGKMTMKLSKKTQSICFIWLPEKVGNAFKINKKTTLISLKSNNACQNYYRLEL